MTVPTLKGFEPIDTKEQRQFFEHLEAKLRRLEYVDIEGNTPYLYIFLQRLIDKWRGIGLEALKSRLLFFGNLYRAERRFPKHCFLGVGECLLAQEKYDEFLAVTQPAIDGPIEKRTTGRRLSLQYHLGRKINPVDLVIMSGRMPTEFVKDNLKLYHDALADVFAKYIRGDGKWLKSPSSWGKVYTYPTTYLITFAGCDNPPEPRIPDHCFYECENRLESLRELAKLAENKAREALGLPHIGEGWLSETELFRKIEYAFRQTRVVQHGRTSWLGRQHYDVWIPEWKVAIEYHGEQHFGSVEYFGGDIAYRRTVELDARKAAVSKENGVKLIVVRKGYDMNKLLVDIETRIRNC